MTTTDPTGTPDAELLHRLMDSLASDTRALGPDNASGSVRAGVSALQAAIDGGAGASVATTLRALDVTVDRLHMNHMRPLIQQTLRSLRTALNLDVPYTQATSVRSI